MFYISLHIRSNPLIFSNLSIHNLQLLQYIGYARPSESNTQITSAAPSNNNDPALSIPSLQRKISLGEQLLSFFDKVEGKGSFIRGKFNLLYLPENIPYI